MPLIINDCGCGRTPSVLFSTFSGLYSIGCDEDSMRCDSHTQMELSFEKALEQWNKYNPSKLSVVKMKEELKSCTCGSTPFIEYVRHNDRFSFTVSCPDYSHRSMIATPDFGEAIRLWNLKNSSLEKGEIARRMIGGLYADN